MLIVTSFAYQNANSISSQSRTNQNKGFSVYNRQMGNSVSFNANALKTLKNGTKEPEELVEIVMGILRTLPTNRNSEDFFVSIDLAAICKDQNFSMSLQNAKKLKELGLIEIKEDNSIQVHESIRNIVNSASEGEGFKLKFINPIAEN